LDERGGAPPEPRLRAIQRQLVGRAISGRELAKLEDGWLPLLEPFPWDDAQADALRLRGSLLFGIGAQLLGGDPGDVEAAGALWALMDGADHCSDEQSRRFLLGEAAKLVPELPIKVPADLRPLTVLAALATSDILSRGWLGRGGAALWHRLSGRFPR
jgi:hypothetical protein